MSLFSKLLGITSLAIVMAAVLYVIFGQLTVRKLRKNPETLRELGFEFISGWDIINVAQALAVPGAIMRKLKGSSLSALYADPDILRKHTSRFDRVLGGLFYWLLISSGLFGILLVVLDAFGVFD